MDSIPSAPPLIEKERVVIRNLLQVSKEFSGKRMDASLNDSVEKFIWWKKVRLGLQASSSSSSNATDHRVNIICGGNRLRV